MSLLKLAKFKWYNYLDFLNLQHHIRDTGMDCVQDCIFFIRCSCDVLGGANFLASLEKCSKYARSLVGDIALCSWGRHFTPALPLFNQVYKWVTVNLMLGATLQWTSIPSRGCRFVSKVGRVNYR